MAAFGRGDRGGGGVEINHHRRQRARSLIWGRVASVAAQKQANSSNKSNCRHRQRWNLSIFPVITLSGGKNVYSIHSPNNLKLKQRSRDAAYLVTVTVLCRWYTAVSSHNPKQNVTLIPKKFLADMNTRFCIFQSGTLIFLICSYIFFFLFTNFIQKNIFRHLSNSMPSPKWIRFDGFQHFFFNFGKQLTQILSKISFLSLRFSITFAKCFYLYNSLRSDTLRQVL